MRKLLLPLVVLSLLALAAVASAHPERSTFFPDHTQGQRPAHDVDVYGNLGDPGIVVCKGDSAQRINRTFRGTGPKNTRARAVRLKMLESCRFRHIQAAVNAAKTGDSIKIMPGVYREEPSRAVTFNDPKCSQDDSRYWESTNDGHGEGTPGKVPTYQFHADCPNSRNLIQILGDSTADPDRVCDQRCNLKLEGMGRYARDVVIEGDRKKRDVIRADRADGIVIWNLTTEQASFNGIDVVESNGFLLHKLVGRWNQNYGILTFTSDNGLYDNVEAYGNGDSGIYPGSGPEGHCERYGIEIKNSRSYKNVLGQSGTAGNGTYVHDSKWFANGVGIVNDSFASGHPGMPQDCSKWENNEVYGNNQNFFDEGNQEYCSKTEFADRPRRHICPQFQSPVGTGFAFYGANHNIVRNNKVWDNWRWGYGLFWVPAIVRGEAFTPEAMSQTDTSNGNQITNNAFGQTSAGEKSLNGVDIYWDEQGVGNCWSGNTGWAGNLKTDPAPLPTCESGGSTSPIGNLAKTARQASCASWDPQDNPNPPGCDWFTTPPRPEG